MRQFKKAKNLSNTMLQMEENRERLLLWKDEGRIASLFHVHEAFEANANRIIELVNEEFELDFAFDAAFLLKMFRGQVRVENHAPQGFWRYRQMIVETQVQARFGGKGLILDMSQALKMYDLPEFSAELVTCLSNCWQGLQASVEKFNFAVVDGEIRFTEIAKREIEGSHSQELVGEDVKIYKKFQKIAAELDEVVKETYRGDMPVRDISKLIDIETENGEPVIRALPTCVPSMLKTWESAMQGKHGRQYYADDDSDAVAHRLYRELHGKFLE